MTSSLPRTLTCYYCQHGDHARCAIPRACTCFVCAEARRVADALVHEHAAQVVEYRRELAR